MKKMAMVFVLVMVKALLLAGCDEVDGYVEAYGDGVEAQQERLDVDEQAEQYDDRINIADIIGRDFYDVRHLLGNEIPMYGWGFAPGELEGGYQFDTGIGISTSAAWGDFPEWVRNISIQFRETHKDGLVLYAWALPSVSRLDGFLGFESSERFHVNGLGRDSTRANVIAAFYDGFEYEYSRDVFDSPIIDVLPASHPRPERIFDDRVRSNNQLFGDENFYISFFFDNDDNIIGVNFFTRNRVG